MAPFITTNVGHHQANIAREELTGNAQDEDGNHMSFLQL